MKILTQDSELTFTVKVHPRAKKNAITGSVGDALKVSLTAPPVDGKANAACIDFFAKVLNVPRASITIAAGLTSRNKVIRVSGLSAEEVQARLKLGAVKAGEGARATRPIGANFDLR
jgi:uncharacterized protein